jgi:hypothetical protein
MRWNELAGDLITRHQIGQFPSARTLAYMNLAIDNGIVLAGQQERKPDGAAAGAAATVLTFVFPKDEQAIASRLDDGINYRTSAVVGQRMGRQIGEYAVGHYLKPVR